MSRQRSSSGVEMSGSYNPGMMIQAGNFENMAQCYTKERERLLCLHDKRISSQNKDADAIALQQVIGKGQ